LGIERERRGRERRIGKRMRRWVREKMEVFVGFMKFKSF